MLVFANIVIITLVFEKNAYFLAESWQKIAENCDHNIDPRSQSFDLRICSHNASAVGYRIERFFKEEENIFVFKTH
jgi:hypothetical protein